MMLSAKPPSLFSDLSPSTPPGGSDTASESPPDDATTQAGIVVPNNTIRVVNFPFLPVQVLPAAANAVAQYTTTHGLATETPPPSHACPAVELPLAQPYPAPSTRMVFTAASPPPITRLSPCSSHANLVDAFDCTAGNNSMRSAAAGHNSFLFFFEANSSVDDDDV